MIIFEIQKSNDSQGIIELKFFSNRPKSKILQICEFNYVKMQIYEFIYNKQIYAIYIFQEKVNQAHNCLEIDLFV